MQFSCGVSQRCHIGIIMQSSMMEQNPCLRSMSSLAPRQGVFSRDSGGFRVARIERSQGLAFWQRCHAAVARWRHDTNVRGSKPRSAMHKFATQQGRTCAAHCLCCQKCRWRDMNAHTELRRRQQKSVGALAHWIDWIHNPQVRGSQPTPLLRISPRSRARRCTKQSLLCSTLSFRVFAGAFGDAHRASQKRDPRQRGGLALGAFVS